MLGRGRVFLGGAGPDGADEPPPGFNLSRIFLSALSVTPPSHVFLGWGGSGEIFLC